MKRILAILLVVSMLFVVGCGGDEASPLEGQVSVAPNVPNEVVEAKPTTGDATQGAYNFTVNNISNYDIYSMHVGIANAEANYDIDILPQILTSGTSLQVYGTASSGDWDVQQWTLYIVDVEGDSSASYETFNPWSLVSVDIQWNNDIGGYETTFYY